MYSLVLKKYEAYKKEHEIQQENLKSLLKTEMQILTKQYLQLHNKKVVEIHNNQQKIEARNKVITAKQLRFNQHIDNWINIYNKLNQGLKQAGDLANYSQFISKQMKELTTKSDLIICESPQQ